MSLDKWDRRFLRIAAEVATWSKDPDTQVGAVLVRNRRILQTGYNGIPYGVADLPERLERPSKCSYIEHAERNALCNVNGSGTTLYVTLFPCEKCTPGIINAGVERVVVDPEAVTREWEELSKKMMTEAGIILDYKDIIW